MVIDHFYEDVPTIVGWMVFGFVVCGIFISLLSCTAFRLTDKVSVLEERVKELENN